jgi:hypothetical protein
MALFAMDIVAGSASAAAYNICESSSTKANTTDQTLQVLIAASDQ